MNINNLVTWNVMIDIGFWSRLAKNKIEQYKLSSSSKPLIAKFRLSTKIQKLSILSIDAFSFGNNNEEDKSGPVQFKVEGSFLNTNTVQEFKAIDPTQKQRQLLKKQEERFKKFAEGDKKINHLYEIELIIFADLKKHMFYYQFYSTATPIIGLSIKQQDWRSCSQYFQTDSDLKSSFSSYFKFLTQKQEIVPQLTVVKIVNLNGKNSVQPSSIQEFLNNQAAKFIFCIFDITNLPKKTGYHTSTFLAFLAWLRKNQKIKEERLTSVSVMLVKQFLVHNHKGEYSFANSQLIKIDASKLQIGQFQSRINHKKGQQIIDLKSFMDQRSLARQAVDLNIKLMKWRLLPSLNIPKIQEAKCLLFGAGTLGCQLARNLIGWGIKNISFIDYSKVSYSNPVRQTLYEFQDTIKGGKPKAETAAEKLKKIYPEINAHGYTFQIPMPGHYVTTKQQVVQTFQNIELLEKLVQSHDVLFLLLDSRQARWLPTVLANKYDKACITVGLGFDSFVIVRHGISPDIYDQKIHGERLCCYFCNDIVTPQNTMKDRTLDQMCTVTKPGLSFVASAYAAELYISLLHHPQEHHAPSSQDPKLIPTTDLGKLPHHLRGNMGDFQTSIFYGKAFDQCVACSKHILEAYKSNCQEFMLNVLNDPSFIHRVTGLQKQLDSYADLQGGIIEIMDDDFQQIDLTNAQQSK